MNNMGQNLSSVGVSNTPLHNALRSSLEACTDWVSITFKENIFLKGLLPLLHLDFHDFEHKELAQSNEYEDRYKYLNLITVMTRRESEDKQALTHLDITGQGCRFLENNWRKEFDWVDFCNILRSSFTIHHITRFDVAIDDYRGFLNISTLHRKMRLKHFRSTAGLRSWRYIESGDILADKEISGQTLYIGKGDIEFRFYDKYAQLTNSQNIEIDENIDFWNRYEIQLRHERALVVFNMIADGNFEIGTLVKSIMSEYLTFLIENKNDKTKARWPICKFWLDFLGDVSKVRLTMQPLEKSVYRTKNWVEKQVSVSLAVLDECLNDSGHYVAGLIADGRRRMTKQHKQMIESYKSAVDMIVNNNKE